MNKRSLKTTNASLCRMVRKAMEQLNEISMDVGLTKTKIIKKGCKPVL